MTRENNGKRLKIFEVGYGEIIHKSKIAKKAEAKIFTVNKPVINTAIDTNTAYIDIDTKIADAFVVEDDFEIDGLKNVREPTESIQAKIMKSKAVVAVKREGRIYFQIQSKLEEDIDKYVNDLQDKYPNINLIWKHRYPLNMKSQHINAHFDIAEFIEELMKEDKTRIKKELNVLEDLSMISRVTSLRILKST
jgi:hypothetical protein